MIAGWWQSSESSPSPAEGAGRDSSQRLVFQPLRQSTALPHVRILCRNAQQNLISAVHISSLAYESLCAAICRAAQTVISSQCKMLFKEAIADSKTGNITLLPAIAILTEEEADHPRPSSG